MLGSYEVRSVQRDGSVGPLRRGRCVMGPHIACWLLLSCQLDLKRTQDIFGMKFATRDKKIPGCVLVTLNSV